MREKELQLLDVSSSSQTNSFEQQRLQELHETVMSDEAYKYFVLGQISAYIQVIKEDLRDVIDNVETVRQTVREYREIASGDEVVSSKLREEEGSDGTKNLNENN